MPEKQLANPDSIKSLPLNMRIDIAKFNVIESLNNIQRLCDLDEATMALIIESHLGEIRRALCAAAAMQFAQAKNAPVEPVEQS